LAVEGFPLEIDTDDVPKAVWNTAVEGCGLPSGGPVSGP
jgi:hypothetical protein